MHARSGVGHLTRGNRFQYRGLRRGRLAAAGRGATGWARPVRSAGRPATLWRWPSREGRTASAPVGATAPPSRPLELFFDLVFVLAITQCSTLMESGHGWRTVVQGLLVLGLLWWSWVGYAWLTSVVDPDDGVPRIVMFVAMAGMLVVALCVPEAFESRALGLTLAAAYGVVRAAHIGLFAIASSDDPQLRRSVMGLGRGHVHRGVA